MSTLRNRVNLVGNVGVDPEIKDINGTKMARISLATNEYFKDKDGNQVTQWHSLIAWGKTAEFVEKYIHKGRELMVDGSLSYRSYEGADGNKRYVTEIRVSRLEPTIGTKA